MDNTLISRITVNPSVCHGKPTVRNMRYPVEMILDLLSSGMNFSEIIEDYPAIEENDILACLAFASFSSAKDPAFVDPKNKALLCN